jgi:integrase
VQRTRTKAYNCEELAKLFAVMAAEEYLRYLFFLPTGCREQEVQYATWRDIDLKNLRYTVTGEGKSDGSFLRKNHEERSVPLTNGAWRAACGAQEACRIRPLGVHECGREAGRPLSEKVQGHCEPETVNLH